MSQPGEEKKLYVDEDWKTRVEAERAATGKEQPGPSGEKPAAEPPEELELPPPDLLFLAGTLYMQAMIGLGVFPNPISKKAEPHLRQAKHGIDSLEVLQQKTQGNRTPEESQAIENMLHELRMAYVAVLEKSPLAKK